MNLNLPDALVEKMIKYFELLIYKEEQDKLMTLCIKCNQEVGRKDII